MLKNSILLNEKINNLHWQFSPQSYGTSNYLCIRCFLATLMELVKKSVNFLYTTDCFICLLWWLWLRIWYQDVVNNFVLQISKHVWHWNPLGLEFFESSNTISTVCITHINISGINKQIRPFLVLIVCMKCSFWTSKTLLSILYNILHDSVFKILAVSALLCFTGHW